MRAIAATCRDVARGSVRALHPREWSRTALMLPAALLLVGFVVVPVAMLGWFSLLSAPGISGPVTGGEWGVMFARPQLYGGLLLRSLGLGLAATALCIAIAWPTAWALSRHVAPSKRAPILTLLIIPHLTSALLLIYAMYVLIAPGGALMVALSSLGLAEAQDSILFTRWAVLVMLTYIYLPFMIMALFAAVERIDGATLDAARSLGAGPLARFRHIILPMSLPGLTTGLVIVFTPAAGSFLEARILGGADGMMFGTLIAEQISRVNNQPRAAAMAIALLAVILGMLGLFRLLARWAFPGALRQAGQPAGGGA